MSDVHTEHCCLRHGCKYGDEDCTVTTGKARQSYPCMDCEDDGRPFGSPPLRVSFDIGGVLSKYPHVFRAMVIALQRGGCDVFVITDMHDHEQSVRFVRDNGYDIPPENILNSDYKQFGEACKAMTIKEHKIDVHVDDFPGYCAHTECVSLFTWPNPGLPYYHDDFKTDGSEGDFGRRKKVK